MSDAATPPPCVTAETTFPDAAETGTVTSTIEHGELFVFPKGKPKQRLRLRWSPEAKGKARLVGRKPQNIKFQALVFFYIIWQRSPANSLQKFLNRYCRLHVFNRWVHHLSEKNFDR